MKLFGELSFANGDMLTIYLYTKAGETAVQMPEVFSTTAECVSCGQVSPSNQSARNQSEKQGVCLLQDSSSLFPERVLCLSRFCTGYMSVHYSSDGKSISFPDETCIMTPVFGAIPERLNDFVCVDEVESNT